ncbi:MAG: PAS domain S-box protein [Bacteroidetes bacterium]|nr:PAS domain S-box protein [Bacteroidota bacterium]
MTSILDYSQDFIGLATPDQKAFYVNPAGQNMVGIENDEMVRKTRIEEYFFPEDLTFVNNTIFPALMQEGRWAGEFRFKNYKTNEPVKVFYDLISYRRS